MKKVSFLILVVLVILLVLSCSNVSKSPISNQFMGEKSRIGTINFREGTTSIPHYLHNNNFYFVQKLDSSEFVIGISNEENIEFVSLDLQDEKSLIINDVNSMFVNDKYLVFHLRIHTEYDLGYLLFYENNNDDFKFLKIEKLESSHWQQVFIFDEIIYLVRHYNYHNETLKDKSYIKAIDINTMDEVLNKDLMIKGIYFTHNQPTRPVAYYTESKRIIYCDYTSFSIKLLNDKLIEIDSYEYKPENWSDKYDSMIQTINDSCSSLNAIERIKYINKLEKDGMSRMYQIGFINDSTFFACYSSGVKKDLNNRIAYYDIYRIRNDKIVPLYQGLRDDKTKYYYPLMLMNNIVHFNNNTAYFLSMGSYNNFLNMNVPDWLKLTLSGITGTDIYLNLVELKFDDF